MKGEDLEIMQKELGGNWKIIEEHHLEKQFTFDNFKDSLAFTNKIGELAEQQGHHPDILLKWGSVTITIFTHKINGLIESDFILAAKIDEIN